MERVKMKGKMPRMEKVLHKLLLLQLQLQLPTKTSLLHLLKTLPIKSSSLDSSKLDALVAAVAEGEQAAEIEPATARDGTP